MIMGSRLPVARVPNGRFSPGAVARQGGLGPGWSTVAGVGQRDLAVRERKRARRRGQGAPVPRRAVVRP